MPRCDVLFIGAGPGGYAGAIRARQRGAEVVLVEAETLGGVCLNHGCIPTKALVASADCYRRATHAASFGVGTGEVRPDYAQMAQRSRDMVLGLREGLAGLLQGHGVRVERGRAALTGPNEVTVTQENQSHRWQADQTVLATGARPRALPQCPFDGGRIASYREALQWQTLPASVIVIGGGVIGCEFSSLWAQLGVAVTLIELTDQLLPGEDAEAGRLLMQTLTRLNARVMLSANVERLIPMPTQSGHRGAGVEVRLADGTRLQAERALVAIGQQPNVEALGLETFGIQRTSRGIAVDQHLRTAAPWVYAIGDCVGEYGLAHVASYEGVLVADNWRAETPRARDYCAVPMCSFTTPEIARVGLTPAAAEAAGHAVRLGRYSWRGLGKSHILGELEGFVKLVGDAKTEQVLGGVIVGYQASTLIHTVALAMQLKATMRDLARTITTHPTLPEGITEAAASFFGEAIHAPPRRRR